MYFQKYQLRTICLDKSVKSRVLEDLETENTPNGTTHCWNLNGSTFIIFINHCEGSCIKKKSLLVIYKILRLFVNTMTVNDNRYLLNRENLPQPIQMQLSEKQKTFSQFCFSFLKSLLNFKRWTKKDDPRSWSIFGNTGSEKYG